LGRVAVHNGDEVNPLTGSGQRLLAVLVAAGPEGITAEKIAEEIWATRQPDPWRPALRMAVARLRKQLPEHWDIVSASGSYRLVEGTGFVDAWRLQEIAARRVDIDDADIEWILAGPPFDDVDSLEVVSSSAQSLQILQVSVIERFCHQQPKTVSPAASGALASLLRDHPYNDRLAIIVGNALAHAGRRAEALLAIRSFSEIFTAEYGYVPDPIEAFMASEGDVPVTDEPVTEAAPAPRPRPIARVLSALLETPLVGRRNELACLSSTRGALVTGVSGVGKSRLLAELIVQSAEAETTFVIGEELLELPLAAFAVALPEIRESLITDQVGTGNNDSDIERSAATRAWPVVLAHLESRSKLRSQRVVVDDAHLLDTASLGLLRLLIRSTTDADITFVVCGRSDHDGADWVDLLRDAERVGLDPLELDGLKVNDLELLLGREFPDANYRARRGLAVDLHDVSGGLPAIALPLIAAVDPKALTLPDDVIEPSTITTISGDKPERFGEVLAAAAVLGHQFSIGALISLTELDETTIFRSLDVLWSGGLIVETEDPDQVRFRHALIRRSVLAGIPRFRSGQLHRRAGELTDDPHERANHQVAAGMLVPAATQAESLRRSAELYAGRRQWRKVSAQIRRIAAIGDEHLDFESLTLWSTALDRSGADGSDVRRDAFDRAVALNRWDAALDAALSGLPAAEKPDGDLARIAMLEEVPAERLERHRHFDLAYNLGRQHVLAGNTGEVKQYADRAAALARDDQQVGLSHLLQWNATRHFGPSAHEIPPGVAERGSLDIRTRVVQINAINLAERGDFVGSRWESDRFLELALEFGDPLRIWHANAMQSMFRLDNCEFEQVEGEIAKNLRFAELHDIQQGIPNYVGSRVILFDFQDRLADLSESLEPFRGTLAQMVIGRAALVLADGATKPDFEPSDPDTAAEIRSLLAVIHEHPGSTLSLLSVLLLSRYIPGAAPEFVEPTRALLEPFEDRPILAGFGAASFGPTTRYVAQLAADSDERQKLITQSIDAADLHGPLLWRIRCRLDHAELGHADSLEEAVDLARGTEMADVVARFAARISSDL
jgi:DNA-binding SARP family transcriptional activator